MSPPPNFRSELTLIPPSPISSAVMPEIRVGISNRSPHDQTYRIALHAGAAQPPRAMLMLAELELELGPGEKGFVSHRVLECDLCGSDDFVVTGTVTVADDEPGECKLSHPFLMAPSEDRSLQRIDGAFVGFHHWSEEEGRLWNDELSKMNPQDWRDLVRAMHEVGMNIIVPQEMFRNQQYVGEHCMETDGYHGKAFYPSRLHTGRMPIATDDPLEEVLAAADALGMHVFLAVGMYAWFDFSTGSLKWHERIATELWERYGHHRSVYGWYVSEEIFGNLGSSQQRREEIVTFFRMFQKHCRSLAPSKPVMLAPNCFEVPASVDYYRLLLRHIDILCPFGFHRMPDGDLSGEEVASLLQKLCDETGTHLWLDLEAFDFSPDGALIPRPIDQLVNDLARFANFEKIICYQFPGLFNAPWSRIKPGGPDTVRLYEDYRLHLTAIGTEGRGQTDMWQVNDN